MPLIIHNSYLSSFIISVNPMKLSLLAIIGLTTMLYSCSKKGDPSKNGIDKKLLIGKWKHNYDVLKATRGGLTVADTLNWDDIDDYMQFDEDTGTSHMSGALIMVYPPIYHTQSFNYSISRDTLMLKYNFGTGHFQVKQLDKNTLVLHCNTSAPIYTYQGSYYDPLFENNGNYSNDAYFSKY